MDRGEYGRLHRLEKHDFSPNLENKAGFQIVDARSYRRLFAVLENETIYEQREHRT